MTKEYTGPTTITAGLCKTTLEHYLKSGFLWCYYVRSENGQTRYLYSVEKEK